MTVARYQDGTCTWLKTWYKGRGALVEFDLSTMMSPEMFRRYLPSILKRASHVERNCYHLDSPLELRHLDIILQQKEIHAVEWVPGVMNKDLFEWIPLMQKIQAAAQRMHCQIVGFSDYTDNDSLVIGKHLSDDAPIRDIGIAVPVSLNDLIILQIAFCTFHKYDTLSL